MIGHVVYDAGALVAAAKNEQSFLYGHQQLLRNGIRPLVPAPVLAQAWVPGSTHAAMHRVIEGCEVVAFTESEARDVASLCRDSRIADVVDGFVALLALKNGCAPVVTSDEDDIRALLATKISATRIVIRRP